MPFNWTLSECLKEINKHWPEKFEESLLLSPNADEIDITILIGPTSQDFIELADIMLELQKFIIPEKRIDKIKNQMNYGPHVQDEKTYQEMKSIGFTRLLFRVNTSEKADGESYILNVINRLRIAKAHPGSVNIVLEKCVDIKN
ncbi:MAG: hypothetical protein ACTSRG_25485 [Candidatus Helarchaeota archaeon]